MPYITQDERMKWEPMLNEFDEVTGHQNGSYTPTVGEMNYLITSLLHRWIKIVGVRYANLNAVAGIIKCVGDEFYRRVTAPYEDKKIEENGCVSEVDFEPEEH